MWIRFVASWTVCLTSTSHPNPLFWNHESKVWVQRRLFPLCLWKISYPPQRTAQLYSHLKRFENHFLRCAFLLCPVLLLASYRHRSRHLIFYYLLFNHILPSLQPFSLITSLTSSPSSHLILSYPLYRSRIARGAERRHWWQMKSSAGTTRGDSAEHPKLPTRWVNAICAEWLKA